MSARDPQELIPLTPLTFHMLLSLAEGDKHGYGLMKEIRERTGGQLDPATGTVYLALQRLMDDGVVEDSDAGTGDAADARRRMFRLTAFGRDVVAAESERLAELLGLARQRGLLSARTLLELRSGETKNG